MTDTLPTTRTTAGDPTYPLDTAAPAPVQATGSAGAQGFTTRAIHTSGLADDASGAVVQPLFLTTTYAMDTPGVPRGPYDYSRTGNPNRNSLEETLKDLEQADFARAVSSGMAAETAVFSALLSPGDTVVISRDVYGGTIRLLEEQFTRFDIQILPIDPTDSQDLARALESKPTLVWVETPSNPGLDIVDITATAAAVHAAGSLLVVDNTFATPYLQQPLTLGADLVIHSTTKFCGGHSDVIGGAVLVKDHGIVPAAATVAERIDSWLASVGIGIAPFDAWLTARGLKTLGVRMDRHCASAQKVAEWLHTRPEVSRVFYPGLPDHPGHSTAAAQMKHFGGIVSFETVDEATALRAAQNVKVFTLAESLGGVESLFDHAATMTHLCLKGTPLELSPRIVRLSIGLEEPEDLIADLEAALTA